MDEIKKTSTKSETVRLQEQIARYIDQIKDNIKKLAEKNQVIITKLSQKIEPILKRVEEIDKAKQIRKKELVDVIQDALNGLTKVLWEEVETGDESKITIEANVRRAIEAIDVQLAINNLPERHYRHIFYEIMMDFISAIDINDLITSVMNFINLLQNKKKMLELRISFSVTREEIKVIKDQLNDIKNSIDKRTKNINEAKTITTETIDNFLDTLTKVIKVIAENESSIISFKQKVKEYIERIIKEDKKGIKSIVKDIYDKQEQKDQKVLRLLAGISKESKKIIEDIGETLEGRTSEIRDIKKSISEIIEKTKLSSIFTNYLNEIEAMAIHVYSYYTSIGLFSEANKFIVSFRAIHEEIREMYNEYTSARNVAERNKTGDRIKDEIINLMYFVIREYAKAKNLSRELVERLPIYVRLRELQKIAYKDIKETSWLQMLFEFSKGMEDLFISGGEAYGPSDKIANEMIGTVQGIANIVKSHYGIVKPMLDKAREYKALGAKTKMMLYYFGAGILATTGAFNILAKVTGELVGKMYDAGKQMGILSATIQEINSVNEVLLMRAQLTVAAIQTTGSIQEAVEITERFTSKFPDWMLYFGGARKTMEEMVREMGALTRIMPGVPVEDIMEIANKAKGIVSALEPVSAVTETIAKNFAYLKVNFKFTDDEIREIASSLSDVATEYWLFSKNIEKTTYEFIQTKAKQIKQLEKYGVEAMKVMRTLMDMFSVEKVSADDYARNAVLFAKAGISYMEWQEALWNPDLSIKLQERLQNTIIKLSQQIVSVAGRNIAALKALQQAYGLNMLSTTDLIRIARGGVEQMGIFQRASQTELDQKSTLEIANKQLESINRIEKILRDIVGFLGGIVKGILDIPLVQTIIKEVWSLRSIFVLVAGILGVISFILSTKIVWYLKQIRDALVGWWDRKKTDTTSSPPPTAPPPTTPPTTTTEMPKTGATKTTGTGDINQEIQRTQSKIEQQTTRTMTKDTTKQTGRVRETIGRIGSKIGQGIERGLSFLDNITSNLTKVLAVVGAGTAVLYLFTEVIFPLVQGKTVEEVGQNILNILMIVGGIGLAMLTLVGIGRAMVPLSTIPSQAIIMGSFNLGLISTTLGIIITTLMGIMKLATMIAGNEEGASSMINTLRIVSTGFVDILVSIGKGIFEGAQYFLAGALGSAITTFVTINMTPMFLAMAGLVKMTEAVAKTEEEAQNKINILKLMGIGFVDIMLGMVEKINKMGVDIVKAGVMGLITTISNLSIGTAIKTIISNIRELTRIAYDVKVKDIEHINSILDSYVVMLSKVRVAMAVQSDITMGGVSAKGIEVSYEIVPREMNIEVRAVDEEKFDKMLEALNKISSKIDELNQNIRKVFR